MILINLIGEQPIPNLIPILYFKPDRVINIFSNTTESVRRKIELIYPNSEPLNVDAYNFNEIKERIKGKIQGISDSFLFNITGATKIMSLALYEVAKENKSDFIYLQSEGNQSIIYKYSFNNFDIISERIIVPELIDIDLYLKAHLIDYQIFPQNEVGTNLENAIANALIRNNFEVLQNVKPVGEGNQLEIDLVFRLKNTNNVALAEIKTGDAREEGPKRGIDQLALASQREYLGTYAKRFLITSRQLSKQLRELALAHKINIIDNIELDRNRLKLTEDSEQRLIKNLLEKLR
jgi:hypothetical protein